MHPLHDTGYVAYVHYKRVVACDNIVDKFDSRQLGLGPTYLGYFYVRRLWIS